jgi:hypothetical protein
MTFVVIGRWSRTRAGSRVSFDVGITLSDEFQLVPEQSTSALVCHPPRFSV